MTVIMVFTCVSAEGAYSRVMVQQDGTCRLEYMVPDDVKVADGVRLKMWLRR